jgi:hypothetical protein
VHLLKTSLVTIAAAAVCLPSLAQTQGAATPPVPSAPTKVTSTAAKTAASTNAVAPKQPVPANGVASKQISVSGAKGTQNAPPSSKKSKGKKAPQVQLPPPPPPTPAQQPPNPARVTMRNGLLTIDANNSTLADVLTGVRRETKAAIDLPAGASGERVVANLGPGTPQNVLTALLNGSRFDYIILGSQDQPDTVQRVILRAKSGPEPAPAAVANAQRPPNTNVQLPPPDESDEGTAEEAPEENNPQPQQQEIDGETQPEQQQQQGQAGQQQQQQPGVKTPEQLLEELRQMQQQQQEQQNQQQNQQQPQPQYQQQQPQQPAPDEQ